MKATTKELSIGSTRATFSILSMLLLSIAFVLGKAEAAHTPTNYVQFVYYPQPSFKVYVLIRTPELTLQCYDTVRMGVGNCRNLSILKPEDVICLSTVDEKGRLRMDFSSCKQSLFAPLATRVDVQFLILKWIQEHRINKT